MRKVESKMNDAIRAGKCWSSGNTMVTYSPVRRASDVFLHGNMIATVSDDGGVQIMDGGWQSNSTKSRLNAILSQFGADDERVYQKDFTWYVRTEGASVPFNSGMILK